MPKQEPDEELPEFEAPEVLNGGGEQELVPRGRQTP